MKEQVEKTRKELIDGLVKMGVTQSNIYNPDSKYWNEVVDLSEIKIMYTETSVVVSKDNMEFKINTKDLLQAAICNSSFSGVGYIPYKNIETED